MANKHIYDTKRREDFHLYEKKRNLLKFLQKNYQISQKNKELISLELSNLPRNSCKTRIRNRCLLTGRSRGVYQRFGLSRLSLRKHALNGNISGLVKSTW